MFRFKKYGEPIDGKNDSDSDFGGVEDFDNEDAAFIAKIKMLVKK